MTSSIRLGTARCNSDGFGGPCDPEVDQVGEVVLGNQHLDEYMSLDATALAELVERSRDKACPSGRKFTSAVTHTRRDRASAMVRLSLPR